MSSRLTKNTSKKNSFPSGRIRVRELSMRCSSTVLDKFTHRFRRCKNRPNFKGHCFVHSQQLFNSATINIQSCWRGYITRKRLTKLFYGLPTDVQLCVLKYIRMDHNIEKKWIPSVKKIMINRVFDIVTKTNEVINSFVHHEISEEDYLEKLSILDNRKASVQYQLNILN